MKFNLLKKQRAFVVTHAVMLIGISFISSSAFIAHEIKKYIVKNQRLTSISDISALAGSRLLGNLDNSISIVTASNIFDKNNNIGASANFTIGFWNSSNGTFTETSETINAIKVEATAPFVVKFLVDHLENLPIIKATSIAIKSTNAQASYIVK